MRSRGAADNSGGRGSGGGEGGKSWDGRDLFLRVHRRPFDLREGPALRTRRRTGDLRRWRRGRLARRRGNRRRAGAGERDVRRRRRGGRAGDWRRRRRRPRHERGRGGKGERDNCRQRRDARNRLLNPCRAPRRPPGRELRRAHDAELRLPADRLDVARRLVLLVHLPRSVVERRGAEESLERRRTTPRRRFSQRARPLRQRLLRRPRRRRRRRPFRLLVKHLVSLRQRRIANRNNLRRLLRLRRCERRCEELGQAAFGLCVSGSGDGGDVCVGVGGLGAEGASAAGGEGGGAAEGGVRSEAVAVVREEVDGAASSSRRPGPGGR